jgi:hypothetical protein
MMGFEGKLGRQAFGSERRSERLREEANPAVRGFAESM